MESAYPSPVKNWLASNSDVRISTPALVTLITIPFAFVFGLVVLPEGRAVIWFDDVMLTGTAAFAAIATLFASLRYRGGKSARGWAFISLGMAFMAFGEGAWAFEELVLNREVISPAVSDIGYLGFYPLVFIGLLAMPHAPLSGLRRLNLGFDLLVATGSIALMSYHFVIADIIDTAGESPFEDVIALAYPICDVALVFAALALVVRAGRNLTGLALGTLTLGFIGIAIADTLYTYTGEVSIYTSGHILDLGWVIGYILIATAAIIESGRQLNLDSVKEDSTRPLSFWQTSVLHSLLIPTGAILFLNPAGTDFIISREVLIGFLALVCLALIRQILTYIDHMRLYRQLEELTTALQNKVRVEKMRSILQTDDRFGVHEEQRESA